MQIMTLNVDSLAKSSLLYITTIGRQSGMKRTIEIWFTSENNVIYLLGHPNSQWWRNIRYHSEVEVSINEKKFKGIGSFHNDIRDSVKSLFVKKYGISQIDRWYGKDVTKWPVIKIELKE